MEQAAQDNSAELQTRLAREHATTGTPISRAATSTPALSSAAEGGFGKLSSIGNGQWRSTAGLIYGQGSVHGNRVQHVLAHAVPDPSKINHSVFVGSRTNLLSLIDEAWTARGAGVVQGNGNILYHVPLGRQVGTRGQTAIDIVIKKGTTSELVTAFPTL
jgi:hypothetical protein